MPMLLPIHHRLSCLKPPTSHPETPSSLHLTPQLPNLAPRYFYLYILLYCAVVLLCFAVYHPQVFLLRLRLYSQLGLGFLL